ncbi:polyribonucleotide nucleotidyltransferase [bacterium]|jgi:polyribonucleotide nucleotidyltransferase|nr:polyribonucleotide nucleotidyltransferase [bacterium]
MVKKFFLEEFGYEVEVGKLAKQADGAVWFKQGGTAILGTVTSAPAKEFLGFLPLSTDYREQFASIGKIPGGIFKREGRSTGKEVLTSRLIDRAIRPLFPARYFDQLQLLTTLYSMDKQHKPEPLAFLAASLALTISKIPFLGPVGIAEIGKVDGKWVMNPTFPQSLVSENRLIVAGTEEGISMVEGSLEEVSETELLDLLFKAHEIIKKQVAWQLSIQKEVGVEKENPEDSFDWDGWEKKVGLYLSDDVLKKLFVKDKAERGKNRKELTQTFMVSNKDAIDESQEPIKVGYIFESVFKKKLNDIIFNLGKRVDERGFDEVRAIASEVSLLQNVHGSALFTRGQTQALATTTLGSGEDEPKVLEALEEAEKDTHFMLHYNFLPFSVGEVRHLRGVGRREIGHGYLALSALRHVLPDKDRFPYTIRVVSDILESNGSSSMATVCSATLALMDAGVPIKKMVGGIAMGLLIKADGNVKILSDISGIEDEVGLMDFKIAGTDDGITAIQMDIKHKGGFTRDLFENALAQAKLGRAHILSKMRECMTKPRSSVSDMVPKNVSFKVDPDRIGAIIGSGGKVIREIISKTDASIDIEDDGTVKIFGYPGKGMEQAVAWVKVLADQITPGDVYNGEIKRIAEFGIFVEVAPGKDGLVHISTIPKPLQPKLQQIYKLGDDVKVKVMDYDPVTFRIRLKILDDNN